MTTPLVTIGIPCYNSARSLPAALDSALKQTEPECEIIVVDDGSTDTSLVIASAYGDRVRVIRTSHCGANHARNEILREAQGTWIQYLDADDRLEPGKIAKQLEEGAEDADVIYSPVWIETSTGKEPTRELSSTAPEADIFTQWINWQLPQTGGALWRKSSLEALGGWKQSQPCCQEHELYLRAIQAKLKFSYAPTPGAVYRIWSETTLCRKDPALVIKIRTGLIDKLEKWMKEKKLWTPAHASAAGRACLEMARTLARYDAAEAGRYHRDRKSRGLIHLDGPAAPAAYRMTYKLLGFRFAEKLARLRRLPFGSRA